MYIMHLQPLSHTLYEILCDNTTNSASCCPGEPGTSRDTRTRFFPTATIYLDEVYIHLDTNKAHVANTICAISTKIYFKE
jgi:hypothetical protein